MKARTVSEELLAGLLREAEPAHAEFERQLGRRDDDWPAWYARYIVDRLPETPWEDYIDKPEELPSAEPFTAG